jgi:hypothetical protein
MQLPFPDNRFSLVTSFDVLEHLDEANARLALEDCARVSDWQFHQVNTGRRPEWAYDGDDSHCLRFSLRRWRSLATRLGLERTLISEPDRQLPGIKQKVH